MNVTRLSEDQLSQLRAEGQVGLDQLDRGEAVDGETLFAEINHWLQIGQRDS